MRTILPAELERSKTKIAKIDARRELSGSRATTGHQALINQYHNRLTEGFRLALLDAHAGMKVEAGLVVLLRGLSPELLALVSIQTLLHSIARREQLTQTLKTLGTAVSNECWALKLTFDGEPRAITKEQRKLRRADKALVSRITRAAKTRNTHKGRVTAVDKAIKKAVEDAKLPLSFKTRHLEPEALVVSGAWLWNVVASTLPEVFTRETVQLARNRSTSIRLSQECWAIVEDALNLAMTNRPVYWPTPTLPRPWTQWEDGGSWDARVNSSVLRSYHKLTQVAVRQAIKAGQMQPALDAINALQAVPFKINTGVLEVLERCDAAGIFVKGLVPKNIKRETKPNTFAWEALDKAQQARWHQKNVEGKKRNDGFLSDRLLFAEDMKTAYAMLGERRFYTPMNADWRGRVYGLPHFNFQREDRVRALFLFADGEPIGEEGIEWLKVHTANCGDFKKISKRSIKERREWCDENTQLITSIASDPLAHTSWMDADKPFLFLAACFELSAALAQGSSYITQLPISFDGSCSGLQHLSAMTRAEEGLMVNLTPSQLPQDVYQVIADDVRAAITRDLGHEPASPEEKDVKASKDARTLAQLFLDWNGDWRKLVKRNVMTYAYSSKEFGMSSQQQIDFMQPLADDVVDGKLAEHPFEGYQHGPYDDNGTQQPSKAARFLARHVYNAIIQRIHKPAEAMEFLQKIAKALAHEVKPVQWTTPVGIPWINRYHEPVVDRVSLFLNDGGVRVRARVSVTTGGKKEIDKAKAANGVAPNFVHALDASHLLLVANASASEGITSIATVHDSFGCLASQATRFNAIIREQFAAMYSNHDVLAEILERATADLTEANRSKLPTLPAYGTLNLKDILNADFAFA